MAEYIDREAVLQAFADYVWNSNHSDLVPTPRWNDAVEIVRDYPAADVAPVVHAHWVMRGGKWRCSNCDERALLKLESATGGCREYVYFRSYYCPNCGAAMQEDINE